ncbi:MAG: family 10 glycosylhydrolase, partial [Phycisphaerales bacterium]|nr:family 10 glycosylhydrolase [Phycisphaerales bacterium]
MIPRVSLLGVALAGLLTGLSLLACAPARADNPPPTPEVRGTWVTTTGNTAISTPENTAATMKRLREIGLNTVYVECWKNGYTQYPSKVLERTIGVDRRPNLMPQDPSDTPESLKKPARDLMGETLIEAHRNGLTYIGWFEYGFMAAHKDTMNHLRKQKPEWLSRDIKGSEVAPNGFVWMNPLHPEARRFLLDLVLEAVDNYDLDGVQLDDRIVWPYITMGYDDFTKKAYAAEHDGQEPPADHKDPAWMRWRADKVNEYSKQFVQELRARRPGLIISLSPAVYPWCWEHYLLEWPKWSGWTAADALKLPAGTPGAGVKPMWDEFIPQNYRFSYDAFEKTWLDQIKSVKELGADRQKDLIAGIRIVGDGKDSSWDQLKRSMDLCRENGNGGHVHWFSR